uniref:Peptidase C1A papain C-terminal domain-containing protein n=1 Tax=Anopheles funestus TaxID=62324 RepID=A0A182RCX5_ANOFN
MRHQAAFSLRSYRDLLRPVFRVKVLSFTVYATSSFSVRNQGQCSFNKDYAIANISEWAIMPKNEDALAFALWKVGPIPVSINAAPKSFQLYSNGIYDDEASCDNSKVNHAMLLLGYTKDYWILKNWWGNWGEDGYMRLARGKNLCGISNYAGYVTV